MLDCWIGEEIEKGRNAFESTLYYKMNKKKDFVIQNLLISRGAVCAAPLSAFSKRFRDYEQWNLHHLLHHDTIAHHHVYICQVIV